MKNLLEIYLKILGIDGIELNLEFIQQLQKKHLARFSFNNIAVLLDQEISLHVDDIVQKIVIDGRGGYCFEHNKLMYEVLKECGFEVRFVLGRVVNNQDIEMPRTHRITIVTFEKRKYLIDVGFGYVCPSTPIALESAKLTDGYKIVSVDENTFALELQTSANTFFRLYTFDVCHYNEMDFELGNFYSSHHKNAVFMNNLVVSRIDEKLTYSLRNNIYHKIYKERDTIKTFKRATELHSMLKEDFGIVISVHEATLLFDKSVAFKNKTIK